MYPISTKFQDYLSGRDRKWLIKANIAGTDYSSDQIVDMTIDNSAVDVSGEAGFEIGNAVLSEMVLRLKTTSIVPPNARILPYVAMTGSAGDTEWLPMGEFYVDTRKEINGLWVFTCYDKLRWADVAYVSQLTYPTTMQAVWDEICDSLEYVYDSSVQINPSYQIQVGPPGYTKRQVLGYIAAAHGASAYIDKSGLLRWKRYGGNAPTLDSLSFDGVDDYVLAGNVPALSLSSNYTFEAWVDIPDTAGPYCIFNGGQGGSNRNGMTVESGYVSFGFYNGSAYTRRRAVISAGLHHIAGVMDSGTPRIYIDGVEINDGSGSSYIGSTSSLYLGRNAGSNLNHFKGQMRDVRIWNAARTQDEIRTYMSARLHGDEAGLVGYWPLDDGSGTVASDRTANGNNGTISGATWADSGAQHTVEIPNSEYIRAIQTNPIKSYTRIAVVYDTEDGLFYEAGTGDDNHTLYVDLPFGTQQIANDLLARLNGFSYTPVQMDARALPQLELGDPIRYGVYVGTPAWEDADTPWNATDYSWDGYRSGGYTYALHIRYSIRGGLSMAIEAPSESEQQSEFVVEGTLMQQVNRIARDAVRFNKSYYGVTHSRTEGIVVEREDHRSKLTLNSDVMDWQVQGLSTLRYDALENRLKFSGTLDGADGIFSGTIQAGHFVGGDIVIGVDNNVFKADGNGIWLGHANFASAPFRVNMAGQMVATNGQFSGTISASTITGGTISGTNITGGVVTGALIRTSASFPRSEMDVSGNYFGAFASSTNYIRVGAFGGGGQPFLEFKNGSDEFTAELSGGELTFQGSVDVDFTVDNFDVEADNIFLRTPSGYTYVSDWGRLVNASNSQSIQAALDGKATRFLSTGDGGIHNHGLTPGHQVRMRNPDTGTEYWATYSAAPLHSHTQN